MNLIPLVSIYINSENPRREPGAFAGCMGKMGNTKGSGMPVSISNILREYVNGIKTFSGVIMRKRFYMGLMREAIIALILILIL